MERDIDKKIRLFKEYEKELKTINKDFENIEKKLFTHIQKTNEKVKELNKIYKVFGDDYVYYCKNSSEVTQIEIDELNKLYAKVIDIKNNVLHETKVVNEKINKLENVKKEYDKGGE